jgi:hypothetical protein
MDTDSLIPLVHQPPVILNHVIDDLNDNNINIINNFNENNSFFIDRIIIKQDIIIDDTEIIDNHNDNDNDTHSENDNDNDTHSENDNESDNDNHNDYQNDVKVDDINNINEEDSEEYDAEENPEENMISDSSAGMDDIDTDYVDLNHNQTIFDKDEYEKIFDEDTTVKYKKYRQKKKDPVTSEVLTDENSFKFKYMWNSITGERTGIDPYGPIYISPVTILKMIYHNILRGLWLEIDGCLPIYGEFLGSGYDFYAPGKGAQPEKYIFRFPIKDCYIYKNQDQSIHTTGPKLTITELKEIDNLIKKYWSNDEFIRKIRPKARSTMRLRKYYDLALCKPSYGIPSYLIDIPKKMNDIFLDKLSRNMICIDSDTYLNRLAVDTIKKIINYGGYYDEY